MGEMGLERCKSPPIQLNTIKVCLGNLRRGSDLQTNWVSPNEQVINIGIHSLTHQRGTYNLSSNLKPKLCLLSSSPAVLSTLMSTRTWAAGFRWLPKPSCVSPGAGCWPAQQAPHWTWGTDLLDHCFCTGGTPAFSFYQSLFNDTLKVPQTQCLRDSNSISWEM